MNEKIFSEAMNELSDKYITEAINYKGKKRTKRALILQIGKYVAVACLIFVIGFGVLMTASVEVRAAVFGWMKEVYNETLYKFSFQGISNEVKGLRYEPGWLPEGTEFVTKFDILGGEEFIYTNDKEFVISFSYSTDPDFVFYMDGVDNKKQTVTVNGYPGEIFITLSEEETNTIVWSDNSVPVIFTFTADCDAETLVKVAENIKVVEE